MPKFNFHNFSTLQPGTTYQLKTRQEGRWIPIGDCYIIKLTPAELHFKFRVRTSVRNVQALVKLHYLGRNKRETILKFFYRGTDNGHDISTFEEVRARNMLLEANILSFHYMHEKYFFQLSLSSQGQNKLATDWGVVTFAGP